MDELGRPFGAIKLCKNCKHADGSLTLCAAPNQPIFDLVRGDLTSCVEARKYYATEFNNCGPAARWFEPKEGQ